MPAISLDFTLSEIKPDVNFADIDAYLTKANDTLGSLSVKDSPNASFWLDDEDPEMVNSAVTIANSHLATAKTMLESQASSYATYNASINADYMKFKAEVDKTTSLIDFEMKRISSEIQVYQSKLQSIAQASGANSSKAQLELARHNANIQKYFQQITSDIQVHSTNIQQKIQLVNSSLSVFQLKISTLQADSSTIQAKSAVYQASVGIAGNLYQRYISNYQAFLQLNGIESNDSRESSTSSRKR